MLKYGNIVDKLQICQSVHFQILIHQKFLGDYMYSFGLIGFCNLLPILILIFYNCLPICQFKFLVFSNNHYVC